jgi:chromate transporter
MSALPATPPPAPTHAQLFLHFTWAGVRGFGGVFVMGRRMLVEETRWLTPEEFLEVLGLCQFMPGPNIVNVSVVVGARYRGWTGSLAALSGILLAPCVIAVALAAAYQRFSAAPLVAHVMAALAPAAAGLVLGSAIKMAVPVLARDQVLAAPVGLGVLIAAGFLHWPLIPVLLVAAPAGVAIAWARRVRAPELEG